MQTFVSPLGASSENAVLRVLQTFSGHNFWLPGAVVLLLACAWIVWSLIARKRRQWVPHTARLLRRSVDVMPAVFSRSRKLVQMSFYYSYEIQDSVYEGSGTRIETREITFDARRHLKRTEHEQEIEIEYLASNPSTSRLRKRQIAPAPSHRQCSSLR